MSVEKKFTNSIHFQRYLRGRKENNIQINTNALELEKREEKNTLQMKKRDKLFLCHVSPRYKVLKNTDIITSAKSSAHPKHSSPDPESRSYRRSSKLFARRDNKKKGSLDPPSRMIHFVVLMSRQGKVRLTKWYSPYQQKERSTVIRELSGLILSRGPKLCNFVEWKGYKVVYRRYASLYFCMCIDSDDNELESLEIIHHFVEILDRYFGSVCELDLIFNFHKAYYILDEILIAGELQESSKKAVARLIAAQDSLVETAKEEAGSISNMISQAM
ncbi:AP-1 complex subunit sigma-2-like [Canna indica]|uniref:Adaptor AP-1 19 kDa protein n=1 Tax=Canna indica TaxID=4628 RepID=A0AAQ3QL17_9LILI|nr:AP-1 complex subunit sigma-2-like [Canna indica]